MSASESLFDEKIVERNRTVMVTGGTGYIGKNLVRALLKRGFIVNLLVRENSSLSGLEGCNLFLGDITDGESIRPALENCAFVFHLAAKVKAWSRDPKEFDRVNVEGYETLLRLCGESGVKKVMHTSSFIVFGPSEDRPHTETSQRRVPPFNDYDRTKTLAEDISFKYTAEGRIITTLYPTVVYGTGELTDGNLVARLIQMFDRGMLPGLIGGGLQKWNFVHVEDVVAGHLAAMRRSQPGRYILGGEDISLVDFFALVAERMGRRPPRMKIPLAIAKMVGWLEELRGRWGNHDPLMTRQAVEIFARNWTFSSEKAKRELNYQPRPLSTGLNEFIQWMSQQNLIHAKNPQ
ncbi:MAG TPA: NAD-dependent epimerase/dehydratase family protein [Acidobacteriota bacterium]|jgi:nucleoside-diphosphate-sugar epimerase|nr:NAD-dependent epimerase/dehydratase family protein [Acidobacteriota bacterium]